MADEFRGNARIGEQMMELHQKLDRALTRGGDETDLVENIPLTKLDVALLMAALVQAVEG